MQEKQLALVTYEQAKKLKELGFDWLENGSSVLFKTWDSSSSIKIDAIPCWEYTFIREVNSNTYNNKINSKCQDVVIVNDNAVSGLGDNNRFLKTDIHLIIPTVALALKWFREVMGIQYTIEFIEGSGQYECYVYKEFTFIKHNGNLGISKNAYEAAESALLDALLEYCEQEGK